MKKQVLTGVMTLSLLLGATTGAMAGELPKGAVEATPTTAALLGEKMDENMMKDFKPLNTKDYVAQIAEFKANSAKMLAEGMTQAEIDQTVADMEKILADLQSGKIQLIASDKVFAWDAKGSDAIKATPLVPATKATALEKKDLGAEKSKAIAIAVGEGQETKTAALTNFTSSFKLSAEDDQKVYALKEVRLTAKDMAQSIADFKANNAKMLAEGMTQEEIDQTLADMEEALADLKAGKSEKLITVKYTELTEAGATTPFTKLVSVDKAAK